MQCSFCHKGMTEKRRLISSPADGPRVYICHECVAVCATIVADENGEQTGPEAGSLLNHPLAAELVDAVLTWAAEEAEGSPAPEALAQVRRIAVRMLTL
jgi:ATP-dependent protease Clp ATPase subunit